MKNTFFILLFLLISCCILQAQQPKKNTKTTPPQTEEEEIQKMLQEAQLELDNMSPEERAEMEKMGIKMPKDLTKIIPAGTTVEGVEKLEKEMAEKNAQDNKAAIAALPKKILTDTEMRAHLQGVFETVERTISPKGKATAQKVYNACKEKGLNNQDIENTAIALWLQRACPEAVWLLAKLATQEPMNANLQNNLSATATMLGGGHLALPILRKLNQKLPNNDAILNNMGQAWCDLGQIDSTKKYLAMSLAVNPSNSGANFTMACVLDAAGNRAEAVQFLKKSIKNGYSSEKAAKARQWGAPVTRDDLSGFPHDDNLLGLSTPYLPDYAYEVRSSPRARANWLEFQNACKEKAEQYKAECDKLLPIIKGKQEDMLQLVVQTQNPQLYILPFAEKAALYYVIKSNEEILKLYEHASQDIPEDQAIRDFKAQLDFKMGKFYARMDSLYPHCPGEGCNTEAWCKEYKMGYNAIESEYLNNVNSWYKIENKKTVDSAIVWANKYAGFSLYNSHFQEEIDYANLLAKGSVLGTLATLRHTEHDPCREDCGVGKDPRKPPVVPLPAKLPTFEDVRCLSTTQIALGIMKFKWDCTKYTFEGGEGFLVSGEYNYLSGEYDIGFGIGVEEHLGGSKIIPIKLEGGVKEMVILHFDSKDILTDYGYKISAGLEAQLGPVTGEVELGVTHTVQGGAVWGAEATKGVKFFGKK